MNNANVGSDQMPGEDNPSNPPMELADIYEKLGLFYLGRRFDLETRSLLDELILYDSKDLVTHAVCVGMTGSGKTGLGVALLEEAAIDGIPALIVDPKGDLTNLMLTFPELRPEDFRPWVHEDEAERENLTIEQLAEKRATTWAKGLADWGQTRDRVKRLREACDVTIFTPGSDAGVPLSILSSFSAPPPELRDDRDLFRDHIATTTTSLLSLLKIDADPIRSREHILLSNILEDCWQKGRNLDLGALIRMVQDPPIQKVGVMDLEAFFPAKDRFALAMAMNNLLAAPGFSTWMSGEPLDVDRLLYTSDGRPRMSICYTAHLSDAERMFFTALLLNQTLGWMRSRSGTTSLRAILYIDEIFGYLPPVAEPPTKRPLLTLLKQARAFGLGVVLATQNPVDLDYKALSNAGTWFLGRLQTERDKERVLDGLEGASLSAGGRFNRAAMAEWLSGLGKRVFLMHNVHENEPVIFQTRWALSYLAGPLTRQQIKTLMVKKNEDGVAQTPPPELNTEESKDNVPGTRAPQPVPSIDSSEQREAAARPATYRNDASRPVLPLDVPQVFISMGPSHAGASSLHYSPCLIGFAKMHYVDNRRSIHADEQLVFRLAFDEGGFGIDWSHAVEEDWQPDGLLTQPAENATFDALPPVASQARNYSSWSKALAEHLYRTRRYRLYYCPELDILQQPGEDERAFRIRIRDGAREERDRRCDEMRARYAARLAALRDRERRAAQRVEREREAASGARMDNVIAVGGAILSAVLGRKRWGTRTVGRAQTAARSANRASQKSATLRHAEADWESAQDQVLAMESELREEIQTIEQQLSEYGLRIEDFWLKPRRQDVGVQRVALAWVPQ